MRNARVVPNYFHPCPESREGGKAFKGKKVKKSLVTRHFLISCRYVWLINRYILLIMYAREH